MQPEYPPQPPNYAGYAPPPRSGMPVWAWVLIGCLGGGCVIFVLLAAISFPVFQRSRSVAQRQVCISNLKQSGLGILMYSQDYDERFPIAAQWQDNIEPYIKNHSVFLCPTSHPAQSGSSVPTDYAFNSDMDMMKLARLSMPEQTILEYDSTSTNANAHDALTSLPTPGRHTNSNNINFADGHAKSWPDSQPLPRGQILPDTK
jgi:prepilin-type processing-associated H-X9-DG protein